MSASEKSLGCVVGSLAARHPLNGHLIGNLDVDHHRFRQTEVLELLAPIDGLADRGRVAVQEEALASPLRGDAFADEAVGGCVVYQVAAEAPGFHAFLQRVPTQPASFSRIFAMA